ncbi:MAG: ABC transporter ATP-binding protein [Zestosphaera sp.]
MEVRNLSVSYGGVQVLKGVDLRLNAGLTAVIGPNGAGKTTLLKAISGLVDFQGVVKLFDRELNSLDQAERVRLVTYVPPIVEALPDVTVGDLILSDLTVNHGLLLKYIEIFQLHALLTRKLSLVSSGELSRALLARGLSRNSRVIVLDEPLSHVDVRFQLILLKHLRALSQDGRVILIASNQLNPLLSHIDYVVAVKEGEVAFVGSVADLLKTDTLSRIYGVRFEVVRVGDFTDLIPVEPS